MQRKRKAAWVWMIPFQVTPLNQKLFDIYYSLLLILEFAANLMTTLGGGYGLEEILINWRQFYFNHQKWL